MSDRIAEFVLTKRGYYADFFIVPVATSIAVIWLFSLYSVPPSAFVAAVALGAFGWTFAEYAIHRWVFHGSKFFRVHHALHHRQPDLFVGNSSVLTSIAGAIAFFVLTALFGAVIGVGLLVGFVAGYLAYISIHDRFHRAGANMDGGTVMGSLFGNHEFHHWHYRDNFGVTSPLWDIIFGTYKVPR